MARADVMAGRAYVSLYMRDKLTRDLQKAKQRVNQFGADMMSLGTKMVAMSAAIATPIGFAIAKFAQFDDAMRAVKAVTNATGDDFDRLTEKTKELGRTTSFTAIQVAELMTELGRAGFKTDDIDRMTESVMNLARATGTDASLSAGIVSATLRQFALDAGEAARVADVLTMAANSTFNTVEGLGESLSYAGPVAKDLGMSFEDTVAILGSLGNVGIQGSNAGTALRRLGIISAASGKELKTLFGVMNADAQGKIKPLIQIMDEIGESTAKMTDVDRVQKMSQAFGLLGITASSVLTKTGQSTSEFSASLLKAQGISAATAEQMDSGLGGSFRFLTSAADVLQIAIGEALAGSLAGIVKSITAVLGKATEWIGRNKELVTTFASITAGIGAAGVALIALGVSAKIAAIGMGFAIGVLGAIKLGVSGTLAVFNAFRAAIVGVATFMQAGFATAVAAGAFVVAGMTTAQGAATTALVPYAAITFSAATAVSSLAIATTAATTAMIPFTGSVLALTGAEAGMIVTSGVASGGLLTLSGSAVAATVSTGVLAAAAGVLSAAWTVAAAAIGAAMGVISSPISIATIAIAALSAAALVATAKAIDFTAAWGVGKNMLNELMIVARRVGSVLMSALSGGDYDIAFRAAMAGVKLALAEGIEAMGELWVMFWKQVWESTKKFFQNLLSTTWKAVNTIADALSDPFAAVRSTWATWGGMKSLLSEELHITLGIDTTQMKQDARDELSRLEQELEARHAKRAAIAKAKGEQEDAVAQKEADKQVDKEADMREAEADKEENAGWVALQHKWKQMGKAEVGANADWTPEDAAIARLEKQIRDEKKKLSGTAEPDVSSDNAKRGFKVTSGGSSAATFSGRSLMALGKTAGSGGDKTFKALMGTNSAIGKQTAAQKAQAAAQLAATKKTILKHP